MVLLLKLLTNEFQCCYYNCRAVIKYACVSVVHYVFNSTPDCEVIHGALYSCLRAMFGLSVIGILVCIFSCMLIYQLLRYHNISISLLIWGPCQSYHILWILNLCFLDVSIKVQDQSCLFPLIIIGCTLHLAHGPTERQGRVFNSPASYSWGLGFKSRPQQLAIRIKVFHDFPQSLQANAGIVP
jgi:hypothetical protein